MGDRWHEYETWPRWRQELRLAWYWHGTAGLGGSRSDRPEPPPDEATCRGPGAWASYVLRRLDDGTCAVCFATTSAGHPRCALWGYGATPEDAVVDCAHALWTHLGLTDARLDIEALRKWGWSGLA